MAVSQEKIAVYNLADLKNTSDDAIPNYLNSLKFKQSHGLTDVRLALGYSAFLVAAACFLWDYKFGFESTKYYTAAAVVLYSILNGALTLWIWGKEKGTVYVGTAPSGERISIATTTKKNVPIYNLAITITPKSTSAKPQTLNIARSFTEWFDAAGHFVAAPFQNMLASSVPAIASSDSKRLQSLKSSDIKQGTTYSTEMLDAVLAANAGAESSGTPKKGGKRRKA
ncbi:putative signal peptidase complex protein [Phaeoacremonium minimum UCRPA7]|uniref:Signal peptidase complex subunit 2 n=1 Tax=Phaeoacremonium minimum (strain UCR-PA7) TaxID=1286976 RepID=R8BEP2_PHAM7|nr:putative signal peptidase complex protein [Phaeoacremonium minimum UCRPA7]EON97763.1 putative signal peptidase complex protein [Phaeoacremonium minimum UCRPA7]